MLFRLVAVHCYTVVTAVLCSVLAAHTHYSLMDTSLVPLMVGIILSHNFFEASNKHNLGLEYFWCENTENEAFTVFREPILTSNFIPY